jgi:hypothetical protein
MCYCSKCGSLVGVNDTFCNNCGTVLNIQPPIPPNPTYANFPIKLSTNIANGIYIGSGVALLIVGLLIALAIDGVYWEQTNYLSTQGIQVNIYTSGISNMVHLISLSSLIAMLGIYLLILGSLNQFSLSVRTAMARKDDRARLGNGAITGGFIFSALFSQKFIDQLYLPYHSGWFGLTTLLCVVIGLSSIALGALLIRSSYLRSAPPTKV